MRPELKAIAHQQRGLVTRQQAVQAGYRESELRTLVGAQGRWVVVRRGVYAERDVFDAVAENPDGVAALRDRAAHLMMSVPHVMSHDSAARAWELPLLSSQSGLIHVTREGVRGTRTEGGVKHHLTRLDSLEGELIGGMRVTGLARTALDVAREHGLESGVVVTDAVRRRGVAVADLQIELGQMRHWPRVGFARTAVDLSDPGAESPGESLTRLLVLEAGLGPVMTQFPFAMSDGTAWVDLLIGCHVVEFDGRVKFRRADRGGVANRAIEDVLWDERTRQNAICAQGFGMSRVIWDELMGRRRLPTISRLRHEYEITCRRFGTEPSARAAAFAETKSKERLRRMRSGIAAGH